MRSDVPDAGSPSSEPTRSVQDHRLNHRYLTSRPATLVKKAMVRQAAARLLAEATIQSVTLHDAALAAGLQKNVGYYYYPDRDPLLADVLIEHLTRCMPRYVRRSMRRRTRRRSNV